VHAARIGLHNCITFRSEILTKFIKLLHGVTLRPNTNYYPAKRCVSISVPLVSPN